MSISVRSLFEKVIFFVKNMQQIEIIWSKLEFFKLYLEKHDFVFQKREKNADAAVSLED